MGFKSTPASIGTSNTDVFLMGTGLAGAIVLGIGNQTSGAIAYTVKIFKQATGLTTTIVTSQSLAGNQFKKFEIPLALEAGDKVVMTAASTGIVAFATVTDSASAPVATGWNPRGSYSSIATYAINDVVTASDGSSYISLENDNTGNDPTSSPMHWMINAEKGDAGEAGDTAMSIVRVVATTNKVIASELENGDTVDGVALATGDLVLLVGQTLAAENGVYQVPASGAAGRASGFATYDSYPGRYFSVMEGTVGADKLYRCTSNKGGTLVTTALVISEFSSATPPLKGYINGLTLSNDPVTPNTILDIAAGAAVSDDGTTLMTLASAIAKTTGSWTVGSGNGGLDTGTVANSTWYHVFQIERTDTGVVDVLFSTSPTSPTMPTNYTKKRWIGDFLTNGSAQIVAFVQFGNRFMWSTPFGDLNTTNPGTSAVLQALTVPSGVSVRALFSFVLQDNTPDSGGTFGYISSPSQAAAVPSATAFNILCPTLAAGNISSSVNNFEVVTNTSRQIRYQLSSSTTDHRVYIVTQGWVADL